MMEHREAFELLPAYVDKELDIPATIALERHLGSCAQCQRQYAVQRAMSAQVRQKATYFNAPAQLTVRIDMMLPPRRWHLSPPTDWNLSWPNAAVAAVTLALAALSAGLYLRTPSASDRLAEEVVSSHIRSLQVDHLSDIASSDQHTVKPWFNGKLDFAPPVIDLAQQGFPLEGGRLDYLHGRAVAALIYRHRQHPINLYVLPGAGKDAALQSQERQGFHVMHWTLHGMEYWAVSDLAADELADFAQFVRAAGK